MTERHRSSQRSPSATGDVSGGMGAVEGSPRAEALRSAVRELESWRARAIPDGAAPLEAEDVARLVRDCLRAVGVDPAVGEGFSVNTVHYYRRKDILDAPDGRTSAARYGLRHLWQAVGARLAGHLGLLTLAEARTAMRHADEHTLVGFVASRVLDARARHAVRRAPASAEVITGATAARVIAGAVERDGPRPLRPDPPRSPDRSRGAQATIISLPGAAWCVLPATHPAHHSVDSARAVVRALAVALHLPADVVLEP